MNKFKKTLAAWKSSETELTAEDYDNIDEALSQASRIEPFREKIKSFVENDAIEGFYVKDLFKAILGEV